MSQGIGDKRVFVGLHPVNLGAGIDLDVDVQGEVGKPIDVAVLALEKRGRVGRFDDEQIDVAVGGGLVSGQ